MNFEHCFVFRYSDFEFMSTDLFINPQNTTAEIVKFIRNTVKKNGFAKVVVGLSGGIDSAVATALAVKAIGAKNVLAGLFPYGELNKEGLEDAKLMVDKLVIPSSNIHLINIKPLVDPIIALDPSITDLRRGNIMARTRMIVLYDLAKKLNCLVLGTENKTEHLLGYFTRFGDEASDLEPIRHLYKIQVKQLAAYLNIPKKIIQKAPTAGLWIGQTDEGEFGFSYRQADQILHLYIDEKKDQESIEKEGFKKELIDRVISRLNLNEYKHKLPYIMR